MVAITVILAAVIGTFVLGLGDQLGDTAPQASFEIDDATADAANDNVTFTLTKTGGQDLEAGDLVVVVDGTRTGADVSSELGGSETWQTGQSATFTNLSPDDSFTASESVTIRLIHDPSGNAIYSTTITAE